MKNRPPEIRAAVSEEHKGYLSPLDLIKIHGGRAHRVGGMAGRKADSMIAVYKDRFTYTFVFNKEVASIHYDDRRKEIFFSGHNVKNIALTEEQRRELHNLISILEEDSEGHELKSAYEATLGHLTADNK